MKKKFNWKKYVTIGAIIIASIYIFLYLSYNDFGIKKDNYIDKPGNFEALKRDLQSGNSVAYTNIANISPEYYRRPEFYPMYETYLKNKDKKQTGTYGYGAYPGEVSYNVTGFKAGQYMDVYTFVLSSYDVGNYQGLNLSLKSPEDQLFETYTDPSDILLSPISSESPETTNWTYRVKMRVIAKKDVPEGRYVFKLNAGQPSPEKQTEYSKMVKNYTNVGMVQPGKFFDFVLYAYK